MGWLSFLVCVAPVPLLLRSGPTVGWIIALANAAANLWSFGVMHNYAIDRSARRSRALRANMAEEGRSEEARARLDAVPVTKDLDAVPRWLTRVHLLTTVVGVVLLLWALLR